jgi:hypothetical protein
MRGGPHHLRDANFYRLRYQLAASLIHYEIGSAPTRSRRRRENAPLEETLSRVASIENVEAAGSAVEAAAYLQRQAGQTLEVLDSEIERSHLRWYASWRRPLPRDVRLAHFLRWTVIPCADLLLAGAEILNDHDEVAARIFTAVERAPHRKQYSYRVDYNLACYLTTEASARHARDDWEELALESLGRALRRAQGTARTHMGRWARLDPSLALLGQRRKAEFELIIAEAVSQAEPIPGSRAAAARPRQEAGKGAGKRAQRRRTPYAGG